MYCHKLELGYSVHGWSPGAPWELSIQSLCLYSADISFKDWISHLLRPSRQLRVSGAQKGASERQGWLVTAGKSAGSWARAYSEEPQWGTRWDGNSGRTWEEEGKHWLGHGGEAKRYAGCCKVRELPAASWVDHVWSSVSMLRATLRQSYVTLQHSLFWMLMRLLTPLCLFLFDSFYSL